MKLDQLLTTIPQYQALVSTLKPGTRQLVTGVGGSARTLLIDNLIHSTDKPTVVVVDSLFHADQLVNDLANLLDDDQLFEFPVEEMGAAELRETRSTLKMHKLSLPQNTSFQVIMQIVRTPTWRLLLQVHLKNPVRPA